MRPSGSSNNATHFDQDFKIPGRQDKDIVSSIEPSESDACDIVDSEGSKINDDKDISTNVRGPPYDKV